MEIFPGYERDDEDDDVEEDDDADQYVTEEEEETEGGDLLTSNFHVSKQGPVSQGNTGIQISMHQ